MAAADRALLIACLCAEWCGTCREYRPLFDALADDGAAADRHLWVDVEDHAEVLGDFEIETFPTLLIAESGGRVLFFGSVVPHAHTLARLVANARNGDFKAVDDAELAALAARVEALDA